MEKNRAGKKRHNLITKCASCMPSAKGAGDCKEHEMWRRLDRLKQTERGDVSAVQAHRALSRSRKRLTRPCSSCSSLSTRSCIHSKPSRTSKQQFFFSRRKYNSYKPILSNHGHINLPVRCPIRSVPSSLSWPAHGLVNHSEANVQTTKIEKK